MSRRLGNELRRFENNGHGHCLLTSRKGVGECAAGLSDGLIGGPGAGQGEASRPRAHAADRPNNAAGLDDYFLWPSRNRDSKRTLSGAVISGQNAPGPVGILRR